MMFDLFETFSNQTALISDTETVSYGELHTRGQELAGHLPERSLILAVASNTPEFIAGYTGFLRNCMVQLLVNDTLAPELLENLVSIYSPAYAFVPESFTISGDIKHCSRGYKLVALPEATKSELHPDLALLLSTSGTTGSPKLVRLSYQNLESNADSIIQYLGLTAQERTITTMPLSYSYGLSILNTHLAVGAQVVVTDTSIISREFWDIFKKNAVTSFGGVPYFFEMLKKLRFERMTLPSLRYFTQAGGKLDQELGAEFTTLALQKNLQFYIMYGQTEATARMSYLCATDHPEKVGSIGQAIPGGEFWIEDEELVYRGPNVSMGFAEAREHLKLGDLNGGVLKTGDLAAVDADGFYSIVGRKNRFLKLFGLRINLHHLEDVLRTKGYHCAAVGTDRELFIYFTESYDQTSLEKIIFEITGIPKRGFRLIQLETFPRTDSGKIHYKALDDLRG